MDASSLGSDFVRFDGRSPVAFRVVRDGTGRLRISSDLEGSEPDIVIPPASIERGMTMLKIANTGDLHLKFDLYITPDGQRYVYTSSCPLLPRPAQGESFSAFESWPHAVAGFAIGAPREGGSTCE
ncbi:MAG: hypothetical protein HY898_12435 [Deltaproteobacteria bacterium]|nr:hypothetical protein [Deltaproteobacteria bacterium]